MPKQVQQLEWRMQIVQQQLLLDNNNFKSKSILIVCINSLAVKVSITNKLPQDKHKPNLKDHHLNMKTFSPSQLLQDQNLRRHFQSTMII